MDKKNITKRFLDVYNYLLDNNYVKNPTDFTHKIDLSGSSINEILKGRSGVGIKMIQNTVLKFPFINLEYIIINRGGVLKDDVVVAVEINDNGDHKKNTNNAYGNNSGSIVIHNYEVKENETQCVAENNSTYLKEQAKELLIYQIEMKNKEIEMKDEMIKQLKDHIVTLKNMPEMGDSNASVG